LSEVGGCDAFLECGIINVMCLKVGYVVEVQNNAFCETSYKNRIQNENTTDESILFVKMAMESFYRLYKGCSAMSLQKSLEKVGGEVLHLTTNVLELQIGALLQLLWATSTRHLPSEIQSDSSGDNSNGWYTEIVEHCVDIYSIILHQPCGFPNNLCFGSANAVSTNAINAVIQVLTLVTLVSSDQHRKDVYAWQSIKDDIFRKCIGIICSLVRRAMTEQAIMQTLKAQISQEKWGFILEIIRQVSICCNRSADLQQYAKDSIEELGGFQSTLEEAVILPTEKIESFAIENDGTHLLHLLQALSPHAKGAPEGILEVFLKVLRDDSSRSLRLMAATGLQLTVVQSFNIKISSTQPRPNLMRNIIRLSKQEPDRWVKLKLVEVATSLAAKMNPDCGNEYDDNLQLLKELLYSDDMKFAECAISAIYQQTLSPTDSEETIYSTKRSRIACCSELLDALASVSSFLRVSLFSQKYIAEIFLNISYDAINGEQMTRSIILESLLDLSSLPREGRTEREARIIDRIHTCALSTIVRLARGVSNRRKLAKQPGLMLSLIRFVSSPADQIATTAEDDSLQADVKEALIKLTQAI
jgi:hypothetical protein